MTVREYISDLQIRLGNLFDWFIEGARLLGNFQWLDLTIPQAIFTGFFFWCIYLATKGEEYDRYSNFSDKNISEPGYLEAKNLAELNFKFFLSFLFNLFSGYVVIGVIFLMLYDEINYTAMYLWVLSTWLLISVGTYNRRRIILKDRESFVVETEPSSEASTEGERERIKPIEFKINDTENGYLSPDMLQIDGASYVEDMDDYEWIFQIASKDFESLLKLLKATEELSDDIPNELMNYLKDNGTKVSEIRELCQDNEIEHYFQNWM